MKWLIFTIDPKKKISKPNKSNQIEPHQVNAWDVLIDKKKLCNKLGDGPKQAKMAY